MKSFRRKKFVNFRQSLKLLGFNSYKEYLASDNWTWTRQRYEASAMPKECVICENPKYSLHHLTYRRFTEEKIADLMALCETCHGELHDREKENGINIKAVRRLIREKRPELSPRELAARFAPYRAERKAERKAKAKEKKLRQRALQVA